MSAESMWQSNSSGEVDHGSPWDSGCERLEGNGVVGSSQLNPVPGVGAGCRRLWAGCSVHYLGWAGLGGDLGVSGRTKREGGSDGG